MPRQPDFYDPQVGDSEPMEIRGLQVQITGTYVLLDDVVTTLRAYADSVDSVAVHEAANWLQGGAPPMPMPAETTQAPRPEESVESVHGAEPDDVTLDVDRVEIFPVETASGVRWHARSIDTGGNIMKTTNGSFDQTWVIENAQERWPGIGVHLLRSAGEDSMWEERGRLGPSPKRLWAGVGK